MSDISKINPLDVKKWWESATSLLRYLLLKPSRLEHDKKMFENSENILTEKLLMDSLAELSACHAYRAVFLSKAEKYASFFSLESNQYLTNSIKKKSVKLKNSIKHFVTFIAMNSSPLDKSANIQNQENYRFKMWKDFTIHNDEARKRHAELMNELNRFIQCIENNYKEYRSQIKKELQI